MTMIKTKSVYTKPSQDDGSRYLIELFWPEGLHTRYAKVDEWYNQLGPSYDLQRFEFNIGNWDDYKAKYRAELIADKEKHALLQQLAAQARNGTITLLYGTTDDERNHANIVKELISKGLS